MSKKYVNPANFILPLYINGMEGRMLRVIAQNRHNKREILFIYDMQSNLEKWWGLAVALKAYGSVTMVDLPGIGGMDSFYSIGLKPTVDNMADYLAAFVKLRYKRKKLSIIAVGFGFVVVTRMLQRNPELEAKVNLLVAINGYAHHDDFSIRSLDRQLLKLYNRMFSTKIMSAVLRLSLYNRPALFIKNPPSHFKASKNGPTPEFLRRFKVDLVSSIDLRTRLYLANEVMDLDNCQRRVNKGLWHITTGTSRTQLNPKIVEQHLRITYKHYNHLPTKVGNKVPILLSNEKQALKYLPAKLRRKLKLSA